MLNPFSCRALGAMFLATVCGIANIGVCAALPPGAQPVANRQGADTESELAAAEKSLAAARAAMSDMGIASSLQKRARALRILGRIKEAVESYLESSTYWKKLGRADMQVAMLSGASVVVFKDDPDRSAELREQAFKIADADTSTPESSALYLHEGGILAENMRVKPLIRLFLEKSLALRERISPDSLDVATSHIKLGDEASSRRSGKEALEHYQTALRIREKLAPDSSIVAWTQFHIGNFYWADFNNAKMAKPYFQKALALYRKIDPEGDNVATTLSTLAGVSQFGRIDPYEETLKYYLEAIAIREKNGPSSLALAHELHSLGIFYHSSGRPELQFDALRRALAIYERLQNSFWIGETCYVLEALALHVGDLPTADFYQLRGMAIEEKTKPEGQGMRWMLGDRSTVLQWRGEYEEAEALLRRVLAMPRNVNQNWATNEHTEKTYLLLANLLIAQGKLSEAEEALRESKRIMEEDEQAHPPLWHYPESEIFERMGDIALKKGEFSAAEEQFGRALHTNSNDNAAVPEGVMLRMKLARVAEKQGNRSLADERARTAIEDARRLAPGSVWLAFNLYAAAEILYARGDRTAAAPLYFEAWTILQRQVDGLPGDPARSGEAASASEYAEALMRCQIDIGDFAAAFLTMEQSRARTLRKLMAERRLISGGHLGLEMEAYRLATIRLAVASQAVSRSAETLSAARQTAPGKSAEIDAAVAALSESRAAQAAARVEADKTWKDVQRTQKQLFSEPIAMSEARKALPPGVLYVAFTCGETATSVVVVGDGGLVRAYNVPLAARDLDAKVLAFRKLVSNRTSSTELVAGLGRELYRALFDERTISAISRARGLLLSPDGALWDLPFAALVTNATGEPTYLGQQKPTSLTQSLTVYALFGADNRNAANQAPGGNKPQAVVVGDPKFEEEGRAALAVSEGGQPLERAYVWGGKKPPVRLPGTRTEAARIAKMYGVTPLLDAGATEKALRGKLAGAAVIHLATHGYTNPSNPMASGILLATPNGAVDPKNDGALQASEIFGQIRLKADLAVLSACETGIGRKVHGEGVIGLTRALQYAGVRTVVASQWKIEDEATGALMAGFHKELLLGVPKAEALRKAMGAMYLKKETRHPYYWAPFFITGDPGPLRTSK